MAARPTTRTLVTFSEIFDRADERLALPEREPGDRGVRAGGAERRRQVGELVAALLHLGQEPAQGGHGLGPVAAGVVHQDDRAVAVLGRGALDDRVDAGALPVLTVGVVHDGEVAAAADVLGDRPGLVVHRVGERGVRGPEQRGADAGRARQHQLVLRELPVDAAGGLEGEVGVVEGVQPDLVPLVDHPLHEVRVARGHGAGDEEDAVGVVLLQLVQDPRGPDRVGAVVERQDDLVIGYPERRCFLALRAGVDDRSAFEDLVRHLGGGSGRLDAVVGEDLAVHVSAQHEHGEQGHKKERRKQIAHGKSAPDGPLLLPVVSAPRNGGCHLLNAFFGCTGDSEGSGEAGGLSSTGGSAVTDGDGSPVGCSETGLPGTTGLEDVPVRGGLPDAEAEALAPGTGRTAGRGGGAARGGRSGVAGDRGGGGGGGTGALGHGWRRSGRAGPRPLPRASPPARRGAARERWSSRRARRPRASRRTPRRSRRAPSPRAGTSCCDGRSRRRTPGRRTGPEGWVQRVARRADDRVRPVGR